MKVQLEHNAETYALELTPTGKNYTLTLGEQTQLAEVLRAENDELRITLGGQTFSARVSSDGAKRWVTVNGQTFVLTKSSGGRKAGGHGHHAAGELVAPMPGQVLAVNVKEGDAVTKGQTLLVLVAMKMEIKVAAPLDGTVQKLFIKPGQAVEKDQQLVDLTG